MHLVQQTMTSIGKPLTYTFNMSLKIGKFLSKIQIANISFKKSVNNYI